MSKPEGRKMIQKGEKVKVTYGNQIRGEILTVTSDEVKNKVEVLHNDDRGTT